MSVSLYDQSIPLFEQMLGSLSAILYKAEKFVAARGFDAANLLNARLAPDMFALTRQVQIACDAAKFAAARISGVEAPRFEDNESSLTQLQERIQKTLTFIRSVGREAVEAGAARQVEWQSRNETYKANAAHYLRAWALPNFFFHVTTAYNILRHNGVELGKRDFLGSFL